jgi:GTP cyclohydrolase IA
MPYGVTIIAARQLAPREIPPLQQIVHGPITFVSHCEKHGVVYFGTAYLGYVPTAERLAPAMLRRMVLQSARHGEDRFERELAAVLQVSIHPAGVALSVRSAHDCGGPRLLGDPGAGDARWHGRYKADRRLRAEFLTRCAASGASSGS